MLLQTFAIMGRSINAFELRDADVVMRPKLDGVSGADFTARRLSILAGREAALTVLPELKVRIAAWHQRPVRDEFRKYRGPVQDRA
jgi:NTE family protein